MKEQTLKSPASNQKIPASRNNTVSEAFFGGSTSETVQKTADPFFSLSTGDPFFKPLPIPTLPAPIQKQSLEDKDQSQEAPIQKKENNTGLPDTLKTGAENLSGMSLDDVKVHRNSDKPAQLQALAYAQGNEIHVGPGQEKHLPHEAWHVVQQKQGRVKPTLQMKGNVQVNDDAGLEHEADVMGGKALQNLPNQTRALDTGVAGSSPTVQMNNELLKLLASELGVAATSVAVSAALYIKESFLLSGLAMAFAAGLSIHWLISYFRSSNEGEVAQETGEKIESPLFKEPSTYQELQDCIDHKKYPPEIVSIGNKRDWARNMARKLKLKEQTYINRVNRIESRLVAAEPLYFDTETGSSEKYIPPAVTNKVKTRPAVGAPAVAPVVAPAVIPAFAFNNIATWNIQLIQAAPNFPGMDALNVADNYRNALATGMLTNNSTAAGAVVDTNYHAHANGGASGIAFRYVRTPGTNNVIPTIYNFAPTRNGNNYQWANHPASNTAPAYP